MEPRLYVMYEARASYPSAVESLSEQTFCCFNTKHLVIFFVLPTTIHTPMKFYVQAHREKIIEPRPLPHFLLSQDNWDDYNYKTTFRLTYFDSTGKIMDFGGIKIMSNITEDYDTYGYVKIPKEFESLPANFASLGQEPLYYERLNTHPEFKDFILTPLNDLVFNQGIIEDFEDTSIFKRSLIRFSEAEKAFMQGDRILNGLKFEQITHDFNFSCKVGNASSNHNTVFHFNKNDPLPGRIMAIIGGNGTGKTQYLSKLALSLSGEASSGIFEPKRPSFSKVIAVSYSAFDKFERPSKKKTFSYIYCGLKDKEGFLTSKKLENRYETSVTKILKLDRQYFWHLVMSNLIEKTHLDLIAKELFEDKIFYRVAQNTDGLLSSGQSILMYVITEILANIRHESLILFDEPEMHLHPSAIVKLIKTITEILDHFNSYAILATHSPLILQEVPRKYVRVFERVGSTPLVRNLDIESFGENVTTITKHVFETSETEPNYKATLRSLAEKYTEEKIFSLFEDKLSLNAAIYLKNIMEQK